jgi:pimeloyl-ACP methyl ester carboxylesterase
MKTGPRLILAALLAGCGVLVVPAGPAAAVAPAGTVLSSTTATLPSELEPLATGKRVSYLSTDVTGASISATGLVLTPKKKNKNKVVVWAHGTTGLADRCAPSTNEQVFWPEARTAVAELLGRGWTVAAPDYPGLGTDQSHPYLIGLSEARSIIDSVKAARNLDGDLSNQYVIDGHSQGGQGALFASQIAPGYDGSLVLRGTASIAPVSNVDVLAPMIPGTPGQGYLVMGLYGLAAVDPSFDPYSVLSPPAEQRTSVLTSGCLNEILAAYQSLNPGQLLVGGALPASVVAKLADYDNPAQVAPSAPVLVVQGTADQAVPYDVTAQLLVPKLKTYDPPVDFLPVAGAGHDDSVILSAAAVADWIAARLA